MCGIAGQCATLPEMAVRGQSAHGALRQDYATARRRSPARPALQDLGSRSGAVSGRDPEVSDNRYTLRDGSLGYDIDLAR
jgi:hypothetical protein